MPPNRQGGSYEIDANIRTSSQNHWSIQMFIHRSRNQGDCRKSHIWDAIDSNSPRVFPQYNLISGQPPTTSLAIHILAWLLSDGIFRLCVSLYDSLLLLRSGLYSVTWKMDAFPRSPSLGNILGKVLCSKLGGFREKGQSNKGFGGMALSQSEMLSGLPLVLSSVPRW